MYSEAQRLVPFDLTHGRHRCWNTSEYQRKKYVWAVREFGVSSAIYLPRFEEKDRHLAEVKVDEVLGLVCDVGSEVAAHDAVPRGVVFLVKLFLDVGRNVLFNVILLHGLCRTIDGVLLHVLCTPATSQSQHRHTPLPPLSVILC